MARSRERRHVRQQDRLRPLAGYHASLLLGDGPAARRVLVPRDRHLRRHDSLDLRQRRTRQLGNGHALHEQRHSTAAVRVRRRRPGPLRRPARRRGHLRQGPQRGGGQAALRLRAAVMPPVLRGTGWRVAASVLLVVVLAVSWTQDVLAAFSGTKSAGPMTFTSGTVTL